MTGKKQFVSLLIILISFSIQIGYCQLSPGELSKAHSALEGLSNCTKCHLLGQKVSSAKCLDCHQEIKTRQNAGLGYHSSSAIKGKECFSCHSDHHGLTFQLIRFEKEKFSHDLTGFRITGAHAKKQCADCHKVDFIRDAKLKKRKNTFLGLEPKCGSCHQDEHQGTLSENCTSCHNTDKFKPASGFDHQQADFKLIGKHQEVPCASCHLSTIKNGKNVRIYKGLKYSSCTACHKDQHEGKFGQNCRDCHSEQSFSLAKGTGQFDHNKARFRLEGKHLAVNCKSCHKNKLTDPLKFTNCNDCHNDYHENQFNTNNSKPDCSDCHDHNGFQESKYSVEQHNKTLFLLKGAHLATPCFSCHKKESKWNFRKIGKRCNDCHKDIHTPSIQIKYYPESDCQSCHQEESWSLVNFDHSKTSFTLTGKHVAQSCRSCHFKKSEDGQINQLFKGISTDCGSCHQDIHYKQFEIDGKTNCDRCHNTTAFKPPALFDHNKTRFPLDGRHKGLACIKCHQSINKKENTFVLYKTGKLKCEDCHQ